MMLQNDSQYWEAMKHRHLVLAYVLTWAVQLGYAGWVARRWVLAGSWPDGRARRWRRSEIKGGVDFGG